MTYFPEMSTMIFSHRCMKKKTFISEFNNETEHHLIAFTRSFLYEVIIDLPKKNLFTPIHVVHNNYDL